jgi:hypothetical protein
MLGLSDRKRTINENARLGGDDVPNSLMVTEEQLETEHPDHGGFDTNRALIDNKEEDMAPHREIELVANQGVPSGNPPSSLHARRESVRDAASKINDPDELREVIKDMKD